MIIFKSGNYPATFRSSTNMFVARDPGFANFKVGKDELLPIPQFDLDVNPNLTQNPGY